MDTGKLKNIIILALLLLDLTLGGLLAADRMHQRSYQKTAEAAFTQTLEQRGVQLKTEILPEESLRVWNLSRDSQKEAAVAAALLGETDCQEKGGSIFRYTGEKGTAEFRGTGDFEVDFTPTRVCKAGGEGDMVRQLLEQLGVSADSSQIRQETVGQETAITALCSWQGDPVWACQVRFFFREDGLYRIDGQRLFDTTAGETGDAISAMTAVLYFVNSEYGGQIHEITGVQAGYAASVPTSGSCVLQPTWRLDTDGGSFSVNAVTGRTEKIE